MVCVWHFIFHYFENKKKTNILAGTPKKKQLLSRIYTDSEFNFVNSISSLDYNSIENKMSSLNELDAIPQALQTTLRLL
jgi:hypothetical protein